MLDQAERLRRMANIASNNKEENKAKIITITSGKGGVGKSNFVINLGIHIQSTGKKVMIFDADVGMGNDDVLMGLRTRGSIFDVISGDKTLEEVMLKGPFGINLIPGGSGLNRIEELTENEKEIFFNKISELKGFDYILMDTGAGISKNVLGFINCSDEVIFLTTPEPTSLTDCYSVIKATKHFKLKDTGCVVVNRALDKEEGEGIFFKLNSVCNKFLNMDLSYLGCVYEDRKLLEAVRSQEPVIIKFPSSEVSLSIKKIGDNLIGKSNNKENTGIEGLFKKIFNIFS